MNRTKQETLTEVAEQERPRSLVLQLSDLADSPAGSPLPALPYFSLILESARQVRGLREVTLDLPEGKKGQMALALLGEAAAVHGFELRAVADVRAIFDWGVKAFGSCRQVDLRVDSVRYPSLRLPGEVYRALEQLHAERKVAGFEVLLDKSLATGLSLARLRHWLDRADRVTLAAPRRTPDFGHAELSALFARLSPLWESADRFFHLRIDRSIKPAFFPWNLLSVTCPASDLALHLEADGRLFLCAAKEPFAEVKVPAWFASLVEDHLASGVDACEGVLDAR